MIRLFPLLASFLTAHSLFAADAPPKRGVSTCGSGTDCSWPAGRSISSGASVDGDAGGRPKASLNVTSGTGGNQRRGAGTHAKAVISALQDEGNLPGYLTTSGPRSESNEGTIVIVPEKVSGALLSGLRAGDILPALLDQSIKASPSVPTPVRAQITGGMFRGAYLLGSATLDRELKRVLVTFDRMRIPGNDTSYQLKASALALSGQVGIEGDYHTDAGLLFATEVGAAAAAGFADATTQRTQTALGTFQVEPSMSTAAKQGAVTALSKTAERFADRARNAPEYTEIEGGRSIQVIIESSPTEVNGG